jgi:hypothetical protein
MRPDASIKRNPVVVENPDGLLGHLAERRLTQDIVAALGLVLHAGRVEKSEHACDMLRVDGIESPLVDHVDTVRVRVLLFRGEVAPIAAIALDNAHRVAAIAER